MSGSRSNSEVQETLGTGGLEKARKSLSGRRRKIDAALEEAETGAPAAPKSKTPKKNSEY